MKCPSRNLGNTLHYLDSKARQRQKNIYKLTAEVTELERQLKQHPMGAIILKAKIKERKDKIKSLEAITNRLHPNSRGFNEEEMREHSQQELAQGKSGQDFFSVKKTTTGLTEDKMPFSTVTKWASYKGHRKNYFNE